MKKALIVLGLILGLIAFGVLAFGMIVVHIVPSAQDAKTSEVIRHEFIESAATNLPAGKSLTVIGSPRREATLLIIEGNLSEEEKSKLKLLAEQVSHNNANRMVTVVFK